MFFEGASVHLNGDCMDGLMLRTQCGAGSRFVHRLFWMCVMSSPTSVLFLLRVASPFFVRTCSKDGDMREDVRMNRTSFVRYFV
mmetsp:Transcript_424/g.957  ORF Transcript_424/g.957 Transcript_424/m.957 type:complete len:84 (-) Transcript_424:695-946(-)